MDQIGNHQREIEKLFPGKVHYAEDGPALSFPLVMMAFTNRCGSTLLGEYLRLTGNFVGFYEHLNGFAVKNMQQGTRAESFPDHIAALAAPHGWTPRAYGVKASWDQMLMLLRWRIDAMFSSVHVIHVERQDVLAQAVSFSIAAQTKQWMSTQEGTGVAPKYEATDIGHRLDGIGLGNKLVRQICSIYGLDTLNSRHEDLLADPVAELNRIHKWLGIPLRRLELGKARLRKQGNQTNAEFIERFRAEALAEMRSRSKTLERA